MDAVQAVETGLTIREARTTGVKVPLTFPLGTSAATVREAPLLLLDVLTEEGVTGRAYLFGYTPSGARAACRWRRCSARGHGRCAPTTAAGSA